MARITYTLGELTGSLSGVTFQRNRSGTIIRTRPAPSRKSTTRQTAIHTSHTGWLYQWQQLTQEQRDLWNDFSITFNKVGKFGQTKTLTGQNWFETCNYERFIITGTILSNPPVYALPQSPPAFELIPTNNNLYINFLQSHDYVNHPIIVWTSYPTRKNTLSINQIRRKALIITATPTDPLGITNEWETATGLPWSPSALFPTANIYVCLQSINLSSGITSALLCSKTNTGSVTQEDSIYYYA